MTPRTPSPPHRPRVFRDPVHGDIVFPRGPFQRLLEQVIDTELFQRLRGIRQTAVMNLVFHGAEHSRFAHSMGAAHVAGLMLESAAQNSGLQVSPGEREETVLAALLHDVGHGPFSHSLEEIIGPGFAHERMSVRILTAPESEIHRLLAAYDPGLPDRLRGFIEHGPDTRRRWTHAIVSSQLDADRLDYLARDALMAGIRTHTFDLGRLVRSLVVIDEHLVVDARAGYRRGVLAGAGSNVRDRLLPQDRAGGVAVAGGDHSTRAGSGPRSGCPARAVVSAAGAAGSVLRALDRGRSHLSRRLHPIG